MKAGDVLREIGASRPLVHHITNYVTANLVANATLCAGALPVMAHALDEVEEMTSLASALVLNVGTLDAGQVEAMILAGKVANARSIPVVLDPVGAGATTFRTRATERLLSELDVSVLCGNAGEVATLAGIAAEVRGVESLAGDAREAAVLASRALGTTVAATGKTDHVSDGAEIFAVDNGHPLMGGVVGLGCASTAVIGCFAAGAGGEATDAETVAGALAYFGCSGEAAAEEADGPGTFEPRLLDALARLASEPAYLEDQLRLARTTAG